MTLFALIAAISTFIGVSEKDPRYFQTREGKTWVPVGMNICFERLGFSREEARAKFDAWMTAFAANGGNFMRVWLSTPWTEIMPERAYAFDCEAEENLTWLVRRAEALGIRLKFTLEHFRGTKPVKTEFTDTQAKLVSFQRPLYVPYAKTMREFFSSEKCFDVYVAKARRFLELGFGDSPAVIAWETWNEINSTGADKATWMAWSAKTCAELKRLFPNQMTLTNLGSYSAPTAYRAYAGLAKTENNDFLQIHRYLDPGAEIDVCRGPMDVLAAQAIRDLRELDRARPLLVAEIGAVEANHAGPSKLYEKDREGTLLHDALFAPFFAGSAGCGAFWHWDHMYVHRWNLWWHFGRFAKAIEGLDPVAERFRPFYTETPRLRVYGLEGATTTVAWCRDKASDWKSELVEGRPATVIAGERFPVPGAELSCYLPWEDRCVKCAAPVLPPFRRSIVVRCPTAR